MAILVILYDYLVWFSSVLVCQKGKRRTRRTVNSLSSTRGLCSQRCLVTFSFVPTPSVPQTSRGSWKPAAIRSKRPAKPPRSTSQPVGEEINYSKHFHRSGKHEHTGPSFTMPFLRMEERTTPSQRCSRKVIKYQRGRCSLSSLTS